MADSSLFAKNSCGFVICFERAIMGFVSLDLKQRTKMTAKIKKETKMTTERPSM